MESYFIRLRDAGELVADDDEAQHYPSFDAIREEAIKSARELLSQAVLTGKAASLDQTVEVTDEAGNTILTVPVGRVVGTETQT